MNLYSECSVVNVNCELVDELEIFKKFSDNYAVSNFGRIYSLKRNKIIYQLLEKCTRSHGDKFYFYYSVSLYENGKRYSFYVHRLVAHAFIPDMVNKKYVKHINNSRSDNRAENLCVC